MVVKETEVVEAARRVLEAPRRRWDGVASSAGDPCVPRRRVGHRIHAEVRTARGHRLRRAHQLGAGGVQAGADRRHEALPGVDRDDGNLQSYDPGTLGLVGALVMHPPEEGRGIEEGHIGMLSTPDQYVTQADASRGVNENDHAWETRAWETHAWETHEWADFTLYGLMPDVDYSETPEPVQRQDADVMARTSCEEARGRSYQDKMAVCWDIMNRVALPGPAAVIGGAAPSAKFV
jgi:hypothetical protein